MVGNLRRLEERLVEPEAMGQQDFVAKLEAICAAGSEADALLSACRT